MLTGCSSLLDELEKPLVNEDNYWKTPCFVSGVKLKKPWIKKDYGNDRSNVQSTRTKKASGRE